MHHEVETGALSFVLICQILHKYLEKATNLSILRLLYLYLLKNTLAPGILLFRLVRMNLVTGIPQKYMYMLLNQGLTSEWI